MFLALIRHIKRTKDQQIHFTLLMYFYFIMVNTLTSVRNMLVNPTQLKTIYEYKIEMHFLVFNKFYVKKNAVKVKFTIQMRFITTITNK
jgi:hypothetical protein